MDSKDIAMFVKVVEQGDFSAAARTLGLTPSAISKAVTRLEDEIGRRLFNRSSRSMRLTPEGTDFLEVARRVVAALEEAQASGSTAPSGILRVKSVPTFARCRIAPLMPRFLRAYPKVRVEFFLSNERTAWLEDGADIAIVSGEVPHLSLVSRRIASSRWLICASPAYLAEHGTPSGIGDLHGHTLLNFSMRTKWNDWSGLDPTSSAASRIVSNQGDMLLSLARAGAGIARLAEFHISDDLRTGRLVQLLAGGEGDFEVEPIHLLYKARRNISPRIRVFIDFLVEHLQADASG